MQLNRPSTPPTPPPLQQRLGPVLLAQGNPEPEVTHAVASPSGGGGGGGAGHAALCLEAASYEELAAAVSARLARDQRISNDRLAQVERGLRQLEEKREHLEGLEQRLVAIADGVSDVLDLNVGGQHISTTRTVLCSAEGSLLAGMFSGNFDDGLKKDKEGRIFLDVDPLLFSKILSHLRLRRIASPDSPAPLPHVADDMRAEYDMLVKYFGLESFMYGDAGSSGNVFEKMAELTGVDQAKLQTGGLVKISLSSTGGVPASNHEEVLGPVGFHERSLENSYGAHPNTVTIRFLRYRVRVEGMELRAKTADVNAHMSNQWTFRHGTETVAMQHPFTRQQPSTGRLEVNVGSSFADEVVWTFARDFCLEHVVLYGRIMPM